MLVVETIAKIRRAYFAQTKPIKTICRELRVSREVVRKVIRSRATEFRYERGPSSSRLLVSSRAFSSYAATARRRAARASSRVESSVGSGELASFMISGISVQPSTTRRSARAPRASVVRA